MNELTKPELEDVEVVYRAFCGDGRLLTNFEKSIMKKLKSMIDEYCDQHSWIGSTLPGAEMSCYNCKKRKIND